MADSNVRILGGEKLATDLNPATGLHTLKVAGTAAGAVAWGDITGTVSNQADLQAELDGKEDAGTAAAAIAAHEALADPHPQYLTPAEGNAAYDAAGAAAAAVAAHTAAGDPHPQYLTPAEGNAAYQGLDPTLTGLAGLDASAGLVEQTGTDTFAKRALGVGTSASVPTRADADARYDAIADTVSQAEAEDGTATTVRNWTAERVAQAIAALATGGGASINAGWNFSTSTTAADPGNKKFRANNAALASVTELYFNDTTNGNFDAGTLLGFLVASNRVYMQQVNDASRAALFQLSGVAVDNGGWWTVPVTAVASSTLFQNSADCAVVFVLSAAAGGGGSGNSYFPSGWT